LFHCLKDHLEIFNLNTSDDINTSSANSGKFSKDSSVVMNSLCSLSVIKETPKGCTTVDGQDCAEITLNRASTEVSSTHSSTEICDGFPSTIPSKQKVKAYL